MIILSSMSQLNCSMRAFLVVFSVSEKREGLCSLVRINYLQDMLGGIVVWKLVALLLRAFNTTSSSCMVRSKMLAARRHHTCCIECELLVIMRSRKLCSFLSSNHGVSGNVIRK